MSPRDNRVPTPRTTVSPVDEPAGRRVRSRRRVAALLTAIVVVLLGGIIAVNAAASPQARQPVPVPPVNSCETEPHLPICQQQPATPTTQLPLPTEIPAPTTGCVPGQIGCTPPTTATSPTPCEGEDCIPQPTTPTPDPGAPGQDTEPGAEQPECGLTELAGCMSVGINSIFRGLAESALSPVLKLLAATALSTPTIDQIPGIGPLWNNSWLLMSAMFGLLVLIGGVVVMSHETLQTRYSLKEIGPRIPIAFLASTLSLFVVDKLIRLANALSTALLGDGVDPPNLGTTLYEAVGGALTGSLFLILVVLVLVVIGLALLIVYVVRVVITVILVVASPILLMFHGLPHTEGLALWWWKAIVAVLSIQVAQSLVLITSVNMLLSGGVYVFTSFGAFGTLIGSIALFIVLFKIPFWFMAAVKVGSGRSMFVGLAKAYVVARMFGMATRRTTSSHAGGGRPSSGGASTSARSTYTPTPPRPPSPPRAAPTHRARMRYDTEQARAAHRARTSAHPPTFLQPGKQDTTHDPAIDFAASHPATRPTFSATQQPGPTTTTRARPSNRPRFQAAERRGAARTAPPIRIAAVPPELRFQQARPDPPHTRTPAMTAKPAPAPAFRDAAPQPRVGDARRRTPSVPPITFRAPTPREGKT